MSTTGDHSSDTSGMARAGTAGMKLEVVVIPVPGWCAGCMVAERAGTELPA